MAGSSFSVNKDESSGDIPIHSKDEEETPTCCSLVSFFGLGLVLTFTIALLILGFAVLGQYVLIPIGQWAIGSGIVTLTVVGISVVTVLVLCFLVVFYIVGIINRFGVERISKTDLPKNRKWIILHGFIVTLIWLILIYNLFGLSQMIEFPESYWIGLVTLTISNAI